MYEHGGNIHLYEEPMVDFSANINPLGIPPRVKEKWICHMEELCVYPDPEYVRLKKALLEKHGFFQGEKEVVLGNGAVELLRKIVPAVNPKKVLIPCPTFGEYRKAAEGAGVLVEEVLVYEWGHFYPERLLERIEKGTLLFLCNPNNPTGTLMEKEVILKLYEKIEAMKGFLVLDETFLDFTEKEHWASPIKESLDRMLVVRALTKYYGMPGVRLGYGFLTSAFLKKSLEELLEPWHINTFAEIAGKEAHKDVAYKRRTSAWLQEEKTHLENALEKISFLDWLPSAANFILLKSLGPTAEEIQAHLMKKKVLIRLPYGFHGLSAQEFRIAVKDHAANSVLIKALQEIEDNMNKNKKLDQQTQDRIKKWSEENV
ncbi:MAG TPA: L-threonine-O-3-phosphate decarboxylase [Clostridiaceae bacterium]|nr:L-threonine-O-3-phosphate decarboxylase [Clostridiaceae bacterium]